MHSAADRYGQAVAETLEGKGAVHQDAGDFSGFVFRTEERTGQKKRRQLLRCGNQDLERISSDV